MKNNSKPAADRPITKDSSSMEIRNGSGSKDNSNLEYLFTKKSK